MTSPLWAKEGASFFPPFFSPYLASVANLGPCGMVIPVRDLVGPELLTPEDLLIEVALVRTLFSFSTAAFCCNCLCLTRSLARAMPWLTDTLPGFSLCRALLLVFFSGCCCCNIRCRIRSRALARPSSASALLFSAAALGPRARLAAVPCRRRLPPEVECGTFLVTTEEATELDTGGGAEAGFAVLVETTGFLARGLRLVVEVRTAEAAVGRVRWLTDTEPKDDGIAVLP